MYTIKDNVCYKLVIKNSKFITLLYKIENEDMVKTILTDTKKLYPDATHYCYGYITETSKKASDDNEPSNTAGIPILKVLESNNLTNVLAVVVRYFGGIKLGANGLIRAYTKSVAEALKETTIKELVDGYNIDIIFSYEDSKKIDYLLRDIKVNTRDFKKSITYNIDIPITFLDSIKENNIEYKIIKNIKTEK